jgi:CHAD domain-containing protein
MSNHDATREPATPPAVQQLLTQSLRKHWHRHKKLRRRCRREAAAKSVHELRITARRLLAHLELLAVLPASLELAKARRVLRRELRASSSLRDAQVQLRLAGQIRGAGSKLKSFRRQLRARERKQAEKLALTLKPSTLAKHLRSLLKDLRHLHTGAVAERNARTLLTRALETKFDRMVRIQFPATADTDGFHRARIALKKFRYLGDILQPLLESAAGLARLHRCGAIMGEVHDLDLMLTRLKDQKISGRSCARLTRRRAALLRSHGVFVRKYFRDDGALSGLRKTLTSLTRRRLPAAIHAQ